MRVCTYIYMYIYIYYILICGILLRYSWDLFPLPTPRSYDLHPGPDHDFLGSSILGEGNIHISIVNLFFLVWFAHSVDLSVDYCDYNTTTTTTTNTTTSTTTTTTTTTTTMYYSSYYKHWFWLKQLLK